jgi:peptidoglycan/LPS O-acetylase OafA/YrhL
MRGVAEVVGAASVARHRSPGLDGLRGVAILLVVADHLHVPGMDGSGGVGVAIFFVLSGYLITRILLDRPPLAQFFRRRAARMLPGLLFMLTIFAVPATLLTGDLRHAAAAGLSLAYVANWAQISGFSMSSLSAMWSLAVEEQFYLIWPMVLFWTSRRWLTTVLVTIIGISLAIRFSVNDAHAYQGTDTNAYALALGGLLAFTGARPGRRAAALALVGLLAICVTPSDGLVGATVGAVLGAVVVASPPAWLGNRVLRHFGTVSFGWYLWHVPVSAFASAFVEGTTRYAIAGVLSLALAEVSWRVVERPVLARVHPSVRTDQVIRTADVLADRPPPNSQPR